ncbi:hypothetical protein [Arenimonas terrae]|uniref:Uncharacterized protein n=1 Tax=Arenimonas terrae TaxID=2546226 RepID=A0A5C4RYP9_9GAMM|nr:hypothetical protein [Arenimonas terrae]TNJ35781.1 hypothetical protein E1B00_08565 [Arenimonas terrae]
MRRILLALLVAIPSVASAGFPFEATLEEMATSADHVLIGRVTGVDMIDGDGNQVTDPEARTGPGENNQIRLRIAVDVVIASNAQVVPSALFVPLASHLHYSLGQIREAHAAESEQRLLLLKGERFEGIKPGVFMRSLDDTSEVMRLRGCGSAESRPN